MANMDNIKDKLAILPALPGCYLMKNKDKEIIYVGKAKVLRNRVKQYFVGAHDYKTTKLVAQIDDFEYIVCGSEKEALLLEINLIKKHTPPFNIMFMDDKSYPYLELTKEKAPILRVVRRSSKNKGEYFGPFPDSSAAYDTMKLLNRLYPLRKCKHMPKKPCLYYHMKQCLAPCVQDIDPMDYKKMVNEIKRFLNGDVKELIMKLEKEMMEDSENLAFEKANEKLSLIKAIKHVTSKQQIDFKDQKDRDVFAYYVDHGYISIQAFILRSGKMLERTLSITPLYEDEHDAFIAFILQYYEVNMIPKEIFLPMDIDITTLSDILNTKIYQPKRGDKRKLVDMALKNANNALDSKFELLKRKDDEREKAMKQLSAIFNKQIKTIELFDNSHIQGAHNVSGLVVFKDGLPSKKDYRTYRLNGYISDLDSMKEVVYRRYFRLLKEHAKMPDLLIVDGGELQVEAAKEILDQLQIDLVLCGLAKDDHHRTANLIDHNGQLVPIERDSALFFLLTQMQDEVHRFAISFHRKIRNKAMTKSILDDIEGIGEVRKKVIWKRFHSLKQLKQASVKEIAEILPQKSAQLLYDVLHESDETKLS